MNSPRIFEALQEDATELAAPPPDVSIANEYNSKKADESHDATRTAPKGPSQRRQMREVLLRHVTTGVIIVLWYASSIVCNQTSKELLSLHALDSGTLTLAQTLVSIGTGLLVMGVSGIAACRPGHARDVARRLRHAYTIHSRSHLIDLLLLSLAFTLAFWMLNASLSVRVVRHTLRPPVHACWCRAAFVRLRLLRACSHQQHTPHASTSSYYKDVLAHALHARA